MADRLKALSALGSLAEDAEMRGDARAVERLNLVLEAFTEAISLASVTEQKRAADRSRKDKKRNSSDSADRKNALKFRGNPGNSEEFQKGVPSPEKILTTNPPHTRDARVVAVEDPKLAATIDNVRAQSGEHWEAIESFLLRRGYNTWQGWLDEMLRVAGGASQFSWADVATVCRDDATLDKKLGSAFVLRKFLAPVRAERMEAVRSPPSGAPRPASHSRRDAKPAPQRYEYAESTDPEKIKWQS